MRWLLLAVSLCIGCKTAEPVQDPLDYLQIGVDPHEEAAAVMRDLSRHGYTIGNRVEQPGYVAFDASTGVDTLVRIMTERGSTLSIETPDVRAPERLRVSLDPSLRLDFDGDGRRDPVIAVRERDRTCLFWAQVDDRGFVTPVFRSDPNWGDAPCVLEIDEAWPQLLLEVTVPGELTLDARVRLQIHAGAQGWEISETPAAMQRWEAARTRRREALARAESIQDDIAADRLRAELRWMDELLPRTAASDEAVPPGAPVLEPAGDGEQAR